MLEGRYLLLVDEPWWAQLEIRDFDLSRSLLRRLHDGLLILGEGAHDAAIVHISSGSLLRAESAVPLVLAFADLDMLLPQLVAVGAVIHFFVYKNRIMVGQLVLPLEGHNLPLNLGWLVVYLWRWALIDMVALVVKAPVSLVVLSW